MQKTGAVLLGVSPDTPKAQKKFQEKENLPFTLLADADKKVAEAFGVMKEKNMYGKKVWGVSRTTFVIGPDGKIQHIFENVKPDGHEAFVIVFKDGHRQSLATAEVDHIDMKAPAAVVYKNGRREKIAGQIDRIEFADAAHALIAPGRPHYIGKWEVEDGAGNRFFITLESDGDARKSTGSPHRTWSLVDGEARIHWEDGWSDVIAKVGTRHEKRAYEPGR